jgi:TonB family protein
VAHPAFILLLAGGFLALPAEAQQTAVRDDLPKCVSTLEPPIPENMIRPKYPKNALRNGIGGKVEVRAAVAPSGKIDELTVVNSESEFSASAIKAIRQWRTAEQFPAVSIFFWLLTLTGSACSGDRSFAPTPKTRRRFNFSSMP